MIFNASLKFYYADEHALVEVFNAIAFEIVRTGLKRYLIAALERIPFRTGFLRGSLSEVERYFRVIAGYASGTAPKPVEYYYPPFESRIKKDFYSGIRFTTPPDQVIRFAGSQIIVNLDTDINYYAINDPKWGSVDAGIQEFYNGVEEAMNQFPEVTELLSTFSMELSGSNLAFRIIDPVISARTFTLRAF